MNEVNLIGRLTRDPEMRYTQGGMAVARFSIVIDRMKEGADFPSIVVFGKQAERYLVNFIKLLCEKNLLREFGGCCDEYLRRYNQDNGIAEATATSAVPLTEAQAEALKQKLEKLSGKKISLSLKTNPSLLGGVRVELEGKELDGTVKGRLDGLSRKLDSLTL